MTFKLPKLPYEYSALEPHIDTRTMAVHYDKHHRAYVNNLNKALEGYDDLQSKNIYELLANLDAIPEKIRTAVRNNGGGHANHSLFWQCMSPNGGGEPNGELASLIDKAFGSFASFQEAFTQAGMTRFGSGWVWLSVDGGGKLILSAAPYQDNPISNGAFPLLGLDVWEHAYYLKYENRRGDYIAAWWDVVNWDQVTASYRTVQVGQTVGDVAQKARSFWSNLIGSDDDAA